MFLLVPAYPGCPGSKAVKRSLLLSLLLQLLDLLHEQQSAYRCCHSTKTAMLKVLSDVYTADDADNVTFLSLLDCSAALDSH